MGSEKSFANDISKVFQTIVSRLGGNKVNSLYYLRKTQLYNIFYYIVHTLFVVGTAYTTKYMLESISSADFSSVSTSMCIILPFVLLLGVGLCFIKKKMVFTKEKDCFALKLDIWSHVLNANNKEFVLAGEIHELIQEDLNRIIGFYSQRMPSFLLSCIVIIVYTVVVYHLGWVFALALLLLALVQIIPPLMVKYVLMQQYMDCRRIEGEITNTILDIYSGKDEIKIYDASDWLLSKLKVKHNKYKRIGMKSESAYTQEIMLSSFAVYFIRYGYILFLGFCLMRQMINVGDAAALMVLSADYFSRVAETLRILPELSVDKLAIRRMQQWYEDEKNSVDSSVSQQNKNMCSTSALKCYLEKIHFSYEDKVIFNGLSMEIPLNDKMFITGENGVGKSTLLKLIAGIYLAKEGTISSDQDILTYWRDNNELLYFPQDSFLLEFSFSELANPKFNQLFYENLDLFGVERGLLFRKMADLSGGERKKVCLSYVFAMQKKLLLLDEPTNDLDEKGKKALRMLIDAYPYGMMVVSHDEDLIGNNDVLLQLTGNEL